MDEYKSNSNCSKEASSKKIEKVISGEAKEKKKSEARKLLGAFIPEDVQNVKGYILSDIILPMVKDGILDAMSYLLKGEVRKSKKSPGSRVQYGGFFEQNRSNRRSSTYNRSGYDLESDLVFDTRGDADAVIDAMNEILDQYPTVSVGDLYDLAGVTVNNYTANNYGWTDIGDARSVRTSDGYILKLPRPKPLDRD